MTQGELYGLMLFGAVILFFVFPKITKRQEQTRFILEGMAEFTDEEKAAIVERYRRKNFLRLMAIVLYAAAGVAFLYASQRWAPLPPLVVAGALHYWAASISVDPHSSQGADGEE